MGDGFSLPVGPVFSDPNTFVDSILSEVIEGDPFVEKTKTILEIKRVFDNEDKQSIMDTVVAGFGNKKTDTKAYVDAGIDEKKIFIVDTKGVVVNVGTEQKTTYEELTQNLDQFI